MYHFLPVSPELPAFCYALHDSGLYSGLLHGDGDVERRPFASLRFTN